MTALLWCIAGGLWALVLYLFWADAPQTPPVEHVSKEWLAAFRRGRED